MAKDILVVLAKIKKYIKSAHGMSASAAIMEVLSNKVKELCDTGAANAKSDKRKTVKDRDIR